jgi:hypothetical protein
VGNEESGYPDPVLNRMMINVINEPSDGYQKKNPSKRKSDETTEKLKEKIQDTVN